MLNLSLQNIDTARDIVEKLSEIDPDALVVITRRSFEINEERSRRGSFLSFIDSFKAAFDNATKKFSTREVPSPLEDANRLLTEDMRDAILEYGKQNRGVLDRISLTTEERCFLKLRPDCDLSPQHA